MKAAVLHANDDIRYEEYPTPEISDEEVLVKVRASGICGSDVQSTEQWCSLLSHCFRP